MGAQCVHELVRVGETGKMPAVDLHKSLSGHTQPIEIRLCRRGGRDVILAALDQDIGHRQSGDGLAHVEHKAFRRQLAGFKA